MIIYVHTYTKGEAMPVSEAQYRAQKKYDAAHTKQFQMKLHLENDKDILEWLEKQPSKQGAIKELIRKQIREEK
jgi:hypothetical protein